MVNGLGKLAQYPALTMLLTLTIFRFPVIDLLMDTVINSALNTDIFGCCHCQQLFETMVVL